MNEVTVQWDLLYSMLAPIQEPLQIEFKDKCLYNYNYNVPAQYPQDHTCGMN